MESARTWELQFQLTLSKPLPQCRTTGQPVCHSAHSLPHPCLEFRYDCLKSTTSWKLLRLLLGAGQKLPRAEALSAEPGSRCPILLAGLHLLLHFGPEELPEFPFWCVVGHGKGTIRRQGLQQPQKDHRAGTQRTCEGEVLAS